MSGDLEIRIGFCAVMRDVCKTRRDIEGASEWEYYRSKFYYEHQLKEEETARRKAEKLRAKGIGAQAVSRANEARDDGRAKT